MDEFDYYITTDGIDAAVRNAKASILSDLGKHPETSAAQKAAAMLLMLPMRSRADVEKFIDGFN